MNHSNMECGQIEKESTIDAIDKVIAEAKGMMQPWGDQTDIKPLFTVTVNKTDHSYTLIEAGITLTDEQAAQIYGAYKAHNKK